MKKSFGGSKPPKVSEAGAALGQMGALLPFQVQRFWKGFLHRQEDRGSGVEVTWLVLAELDLNPSFFGLVGEGGEGVGAIVRARRVRSPGLVGACTAVPCLLGVFTVDTVLLWPGPTWA